jgi:hypothetical protein
MCCLLWFLNKGSTVILLFIFISIIKFSIYLCSKLFSSCRVIFCFTKPDYRWIQITSPPKLLRISEGLLYINHNKSVTEYFNLSSQNFPARIKRTGMSGIRLVVRASWIRSADPDSRRQNGKMSALGHFVIHWGPNENHVIYSNADDMEY